MGNWDKGLKSLVANCPLAFAELILRELNIAPQGVTVVAQLDTKFQGYNLDADSLLLASLAFKEKASLDWLEKEYRMMMDFLKEAPAYHWMTDDARKEGLEQGLEQGLELGRVEALRLAISNIINENFPDLSADADAQLALIHHTAPLNALIVHLFKAHTPEEVKSLLFDAIAESQRVDQAEKAATQEESQ